MDKELLDGLVIACLLYARAFFLLHLHFLTPHSSLLIAEWCSLSACRSVCVDRKSRGLREQRAYHYRKMLATLCIYLLSPCFFYVFGGWPPRCSPHEKSMPIHQQPAIEMAWAEKAFKQAETYFKVCSSSLFLLSFYRKCTIHTSIASQLPPLTNELICIPTCFLCVQLISTIDPRGLRLTKCVRCIVYIHLACA